MLGEVDTSLVGTGQLFEPLLSAARSVVVDLDGVEFLGSAGLLVLFETNELANREQCSCGWRALDATELWDHFTVAETVSEALDRLA